MYLRNLLFFLTAAFLLQSCGNKDTNTINTELNHKMNNIAEDYVKLVLHIGQYDPGYVDAYYGPENWKPEEKREETDTAKVYSMLSLKTDTLLNRLEALANYKAADIEKMRFRFLYKQLLAVKAELFILAGGRLSFDEESAALYDAQAPEHENGYFKNVIDELDKTLPGKGDLSKRLADFRSNFIIPKDKLDTVFSAAINECRKRTLEHIELPANENFKVEYVSDKPWGGYNWYKGNYFSLIQVNTDLPIYIDRAVDLAAHEGYPGHHVYNTLLEENMVKKNGWMEFTVYPLYSPQSLIAEGTANYGINVVFPGKSRIKFEHDVLFPLAGLDSSKAATYYKVLGLLDDLKYAGNEAARNYLNGKWDKDETVKWLAKYALMTPERAEKRISFINAYRSYVINYNLGQDLVKEFIERNGGTKDNPARRWKLFIHLLSTPQTPSGLAEEEVKINSGSIN